MNWAFYLSAVFVPLGAFAVIFAPSTSKDPDRKVGFFGMLALGSGMMAFVVGMELTKSH
jgi:hypothetical protein